MSEVEKVYLNHSGGEVEVVYPGAVFGHGLHRPSRTKVAQVPEIPLDLSEPQRCYHTEDKFEQGEGHVIVTKVRCENKATQDGRHGWLCATHQDKVYGNLTQLRIEVERQIIADILATDKRLIKAGRREQVRLTTKGLKITYLV